MSASQGAPAREVEGQLQLGVFGRSKVAHDVCGLLERDLADHDAFARVGVQQQAHIAQQLMGPGVAVAVHQVIATGFGTQCHVLERRVAANEVHRVCTETVDTAVEPEPQGVEHRLLNTRVVPVQVRLSWHEEVQGSMSQ